MNLTWAVWKQEEGLSEHLGTLRAIAYGSRPRTPTRTDLHPYSLGFASIDSQTWKPIIKEGKDQWLTQQPDKYSIIRNAIITNRETFATILVKFAKDEGLDGVDIDWEYPGGGSPIGAKTDGVNYLRFLTTLREKLGSDMSLSIAAPASYWYLKAFPIDRISKVVDYIVYMTYDLHGQWDYGNPNAFDECPSGKCIRSHVNMTETRRALSMITKAGVANNKIFVGESSYGRSFRMAKSDCWKPECEFTGSKAVFRCSPWKMYEGGYISNAEINEILCQVEARSLSTTRAPSRTSYSITEAASTARARGPGVPAPKATDTWKSEHIGRWRHKSHRDEPDCDMDEWPPFYLHSQTSDTFKQSGVDRTGQRMRWLKGDHNTGAARQWRVVCFGPALDGMTIDNFYKMVKEGKEGPKAVTADITRSNVEVDAEVRPELTLTYEFDEPAFVGNKLRDAGL
ncbi:hypothetical protein HYE68_008852 [Fusarium pseudograminearum]|nr:hypothetical protein HYE68_008852 [Fusarium pseudograminearum]